ncbi:MAG: hypothetical protein ACK4PK_03090 [Alphaproteobacteria bacterium]
MKYTKILFLAVFMLAFLTPAVAPAMGERPNPQKSSMCDTSNAIKKFVLTSDNGEIKETFNVPVRYMSMEFERNGRVSNTLHLAAVLENLEPRCGVDGNVAPNEQSLTIQLLPNLYPENWVKALRERYLDNNKFQETELDKYSNFIVKTRTRPLPPIAGGVARYSDVSVYPKKDAEVPVDFFIECRLLTDGISLSLCKARFPYKGNISIIAMFEANHLEDFKRIYDSSISLIEKFHTK